MNILVINAGSSTVKYRLFDMGTNMVMAQGLVERIGEETGAFKHEAYPGSDQEKVVTGEQPIKDHTVAVNVVVEQLTGSEAGVIADKSDIHGVGHRVVHGGEFFTKPTIITQQVVDDLTSIIPLAPLHNPGAVAGIKVALELFPVKQVVVMDTAFHQTIPPKAYVYPLPYEFYEDLKVRRYGFHGTSHNYVSSKAAEYLGIPYEEFSCITMHLGSGCSMDAIKNGKCIDTSMGLTPLGGLMMGTRCGDIDPAICAFLAEHKGLDARSVDNILNKQSGLKGVCGDNDMRDVHARRENGDERAQLAFEMFCYRVKHFLGAYFASIGKIQAIIFTAGVGENDPKVRQAVCEDLEHLGIVIDKEKNYGFERGKIVEINADNSAIRILVVPTDEEYAIATQTLKTISE
ncbi:acetate kinase [Desulfovibrio inopinatus]|uniref:acetate kinase n=1 Tax=Desulfovibrio inopinatus TaxID=102109 RepID=UPI00041BE3DF|nr:acetate kinase [Desulfovibrio inopinatus]